MLAAKPPVDVVPPGSTLAPWQQRILIEKEELNEKVKKLAAFLATEPFDALPPAEQDRLTRQLDVMIQYRSVLTERIMAWKSDAPEVVDTLGPSELQTISGTV